MALHRYPANRVAPLHGVADLVLSGLVIPTHAEDWHGQLRSAAHDFRRLALTHPDVVLLLVTRPLATRLGLRPLGTSRPLEQILELLIAAGFVPTRALHVAARRADRPADWSAGGRAYSTWTSQTVAVPSFAFSTSALRSLGDSAVVQSGTTTTAEPSSRSTNSVRPWSQMSSGWRTSSAPDDP